MLFGLADDERDARAARRARPLGVITSTRNELVHLTRHLQRKLTRWQQYESLQWHAGREDLGGRQAQCVGALLGGRG